MNKFEMKDENNNSCLFFKNGNSRGFLEAYPGDAVDLQRATSKNRRGRVQPQYVHTLDTSGGGTKGVVMSDLSIRKLTPKECWRLFGFSTFKKKLDENGNVEQFEFNGKMLDKLEFDDSCYELAASGSADISKGNVTSKSQMYKQSGNSIIVNILQDILQQLIPNDYKENQLNALELFGGIGAFTQAAKRNGYNLNVLDYVEIDKFACHSYNAINGTNFNPQDISQWDKDIGNVDIIMHGSPCFTSDTFILTKDGYKPIVDVKVGDYVLDKNNEYKKVVNFFNQGSKNIWEINAMGSDIVKTTYNHRFLVRTRYREWDNQNRKYVRKFTEPTWKQCKDLTKDDFLGTSINQNSIMPTWNGIHYTRGKDSYNVCTLDLNDKRLWYLCGRYLGDGWLRNRKERNNNLSNVIICCGKKKDEQIEKEIGDLFHFTKSEERTTFKYNFANKELAYFLLQFGKGAKNKKIPSFVFDMPVDYISELLRGYFDSDGNVGENGLYQATSISRELMYGISQLVAKVYHVKCRMYHSKRSEKCVIENRVENQNDTYSINFYKKAKKQNVQFYENGYLWSPINNVTQTSYEEEVFDIEVEDSHSFTANGVIAHNCQSFSIAGLQHGGDKGSGTRSSLMWETVRIVSKTKPKYVIWENVKNILSYKHIKNFQQYLDEMESLGYVNHYKVINGKHHDIPQNRERVFTISIRKDLNQQFKFPQENELQYCLAQFLEDNVSDEYYLTDDMLEVYINKEKMEVVKKEKSRKDNSNKNKKQFLCDYLVENGMVEIGDVVKHSYSQNRLDDWDNRGVETKGGSIAPCLTTRADTLGVVCKARVNKHYIEEE